MKNALVLILALFLTIAIYWISKHPKSAPRLTRSVPFIPIVCLIIWIAFTCIWSKLLINTIFNILCIGMVIIGFKLLQNKKKLGLFVIITSALLHISNSFLFMNGKFIPTDNIEARWLPVINERAFYASVQESLIGCITIDSLCLIMLLLPLIIKDESGIRPYTYLEPIGITSKKIIAMRVFCVFSIIAFISIMIIFPVWRFKHDGIKEYETTYYYPHPYYDMNGDLGYYSIRWFFGDVSFFVVNPKEIHDALKKSDYAAKEKKEKKEKAQIEDKDEYQKPTYAPSKVEHTEIVDTEQITLITIQEGSLTRTYVKLTDGLLIDINTYLSQINGINSSVNNGYNVPTNNGYMPPVNNGYNVPTNNGYMPPVNNGFYPPVSIQQPFGPLQGTFSVKSEYECPDCHGLKLCPRCGGTTRRPVESWDGYSYIPCSYCDATGRCPNCKGAGVKYE